MSNTKLSELDAASSVAAEDLLYLVQGGVSKKLPASVLQQSSGGNMLFQRNLILTQAQILDLHNTPVEIVPAVVGAVIVPVGLAAGLAGAVFVEDGAGSIAELLVSGAPFGNDVAGVSLADIFEGNISGGGLSFAIGEGTTIAATAASAITNQPLIVRNTQGPWTGGSAVKLCLLYRLYNPTTNRFLTTSDGVTPDEPVLSEAIVTITAAQLKDLVANPVELVPAPGVGKAIVPVSAFYDYKFGTVAFADIPNTAGAILSIGNSFAESTPHFSDDGALRAAIVGSESAAATCTPASDKAVRTTFENVALKLWGDPNGTNFTDGDGTLTVHVLYRVVDLS